ncbi:hypothetical protein EBB79_04985 [Parasedimentitalea marina]|uniref:Uncharacterized protein n=1 Tax=Parasedimentitalea marina TaxID=2483033 RepID=A0A3T0MZX2_9RHOB|nr:hypothetical protein EBB79_04985 [Parasedimentitalea marina]
MYDWLAFCLQRVCCSSGQIIYSAVSQPGWRILIAVAALGDVNEALKSLGVARAAEVDSKHPM